MEVETRVILKAQELFLARGIKSVTVDQICFEIGISKRTLYEVFKDKNELISVVIKQLAKDSYDQHLEILHSSENVVEALMRYHHLSMSNMAKVNCLFYEDLKRFYPSLLLCFFPKASERSSIFYLLISRGIQEGIFRSEINPEIISEFIQNFMLTLFHSKKTLFERMPSNTDIKNSIMAPLFRGISTTKGLELASKYEEFNTL